jgi:hypothetical protein
MLAAFSSGAAAATATVTAAPAPGQHEASAQPLTTPVPSGALAGLDAPALPRALATATTAPANAPLVATLLRTDAEAHVASGLRGSGLGAAAARAFSTALVRTAAVAATAAAEPAAAAAYSSAVAPLAAAAAVPSSPGGGPDGGDGGSGRSSGLAGTVVAFRSSSTKLALAVDEKGWVQADKDAGSSLASRSFEVVDAGKTHPSRTQVTLRHASHTRTSYNLKNACAHAHSRENCTLRQVDDSSSPQPDSLGGLSCPSLNCVNNL